MPEVYRALLTYFQKITQLQEQLQALKTFM